ncbi:MAG: gliding motility lipoprotein GldH [Bacteroidetes bacterium]|nr:gliding motility lipoprotein GldH [Bacteroidota bacterium]
METGTGTGTARIILVLFGTLILNACQHDILYTGNVEFPHEGWNRDKQARFTAEITDTAALASVNFILRTGSAYPYRNIYLFVSAYAPGGQTLKDTIEFMVADEKGNRYGRGAGDIRELTLNYRKNVFFPEKGPYVFVVEQAMRNEILDGVYDFGIIIRREPENTR